MNLLATEFENRRQTENKRIQKIRRSRSIDYLEPLHILSRYYQPYRNYNIEYPSVSSRLNWVPLPPQASVAPHLGPMGGANSDDWTLIDTLLLFIVIPLRFQRLLFELKDAAAANSLNRT
jgi:hypothetical protein